MLNHIDLMGRLTRDPDLRRTRNDNPVATFTLAVDRPFQSNGNREADFIDIVAWRRTAEFVDRNFSKGQLVAVSGRLQTRSYTDTDGKRRNVVEVIADDVYFAGPKLKGAEAPIDAAQFVEDDDGELPF